MRTVILGDIHLGSPLCRTAQLSGVLDSVPFDRLVLNGDIFDDLNFRRLKPRHWEVLKLVRALADGGCEVVWIFGNHDGSSHALERLLGVKVHSEFTFPFHGEKVLVLHGHEFDKFHNATRGLNTLRGYFYGFALWFDVPRKTAIQWVQRSSTIFKRATRKVKEKAFQKARARGVRYIVVGHTHHREEDHEGGVTFLNPSSWLTSQPAYVLFDDDDPKPELVIVGRRPHRRIADALRARMKVTGRRVSRRIAR